MPSEDLKIENISDSWLSAHLYYSPPWEKILTGAVYPFVKDVIYNKLAEKFFFVRYWERGYHLRLRFSGEEGTLVKSLKPKIDLTFNEYFRRQPSSKRFPPAAGEVSVRDLPNNSIQYAAYKPEFDRYGGIEGMNIAHNQFYFSSLMVLSILSKIRHSTKNYIFPAAIQMHLGLTHAMNLNLTESCKFYKILFQRQLDAYSKSLNSTDGRARTELTIKNFEKTAFEDCQAVQPFIRKVYESLSNSLLTQSNWLNFWTENMAEIAKQLESLQKKRNLKVKNRHLTDNNSICDFSEENTVWIILESYIHMTNNRLGISNYDEVYLAYFIYKNLELYADSY